MEKPRQILILTENAPLVGYWAEALKLMRDEGLGPILCTIHERGPLHEYAEELGGPTFALNVGRARLYPLAVARLRRLLSTLAPDLIHASEPIPAVIGGIAARATGCICLYHRHHVTVEQRGLWYRAMAKAAPVISSHTMAVSDAVRAHVERNERSVRSICVALNGIPEPRPVTEDELLRMRVHLHLEPEEKVVLFVGGMRPVKGHRTMLSAWGHVSVPTGARQRLIFVGDGVERAAIEGEARRMGLSGVEFVGWKQDVAPWFKLANVAAVPSYQESSGLVALEAMAAERPVVASAIGGLPEIVQDEVTGKLVPPADAQSLAIAVTELLSDDAKSKDLGQAGRRRYEQNFTTRAMVSRWQHCYEEVISASTDHPVR